MQALSKQGLSKQLLHGHYFNMNAIPLTEYQKQAERMFDVTGEDIEPDVNSYMDTLVVYVADGVEQVMTELLNQAYNNRMAALEGERALSRHGNARSLLTPLSIPPIPTVVELYAAARPIHYAREMEKLLIKEMAVIGNWGEDDFSLPHITQHPNPKAQTQGIFTPPCLSFGSITNEQIEPFPIESEHHYSVFKAELLRNRLFFFDSEAVEEDGQILYHSTGLIDWNSGLEAARAAKQRSASNIGAPEMGAILNATMRRQLHLWVPEQEADWTNLLDEDKLSFFIDVVTNEAGHRFPRLCIYDKQNEQVFPFEHAADMKQAFEDGALLQQIIGQSSAPGVKR